ncbi:Cytoplasmic protein, partial [Monkeypox virus]
PPPK